MTARELEAALFTHANQPRVSCGTQHMTMLKETPQRVIAYFQDTHVKYAA